MTLIPVLDMGNGCFSSQITTEQRFTYVGYRETVPVTEKETKIRDVVFSKDSYAAKVQTPIRQGFTEELVLLTANLSTPTIMALRRLVI